MYRRNYNILCFFKTCSRGRGYVRSETISRNRLLASLISCRDSETIKQVLLFLSLLAMIPLWHKKGGISVALLGCKTIAL